MKALSSPFTPLAVMALLPLVWWLFFLIWVALADGWSWGDAPGAAFVSGIALPLLYSLALAAYLVAGMIAGIVVGIRRWITKTEASAVTWLWTIVTITLLPFFCAVTLVAQA